MGRVGGNQAGVGRERVAGSQSFVATAAEHDLEDLAEEIALGKPAMSVLREGRKIGDAAIAAEIAKPAIGEIEVVRPRSRTDGGLAASPSQIRRSDRTPKQSPTSSIRIIWSGSIEGRPIAL